jgi:hypothetical protein
MSVPYDLFLVVAMMGLPYHTKAIEGAAVDPQVIIGHHSLAGRSPTSKNSSWFQLEQRW